MSKSGKEGTPRMYVQAGRRLGLVILEGRACKGVTYVSSQNEAVHYSRGSHCPVYTQSASPIHIHEAHS